MILSQQNKKGLKYDLRNQQRSFVDLDQRPVLLSNADCRRVLDFGRECKQRGRRSSIDSFHCNLPLGNYIFLAAKGSRRKGLTRTIHGGAA